MVPRAIKRSAYCRFRGTTFEALIEYFISGLPDLCLRKPCEQKLYWAERRFAGSLCEFDRLTESPPMSEDYEKLGISSEVLRCDWTTPYHLEALNYWPPAYRNIITRTIS